MKQQLLIAGGGIGGLAAALGAAHAHWHVRLFEQSSQFAEVGAGIQLSPNVMRRLQAWKLHGALQQVIALPQTLCVRSAISAHVLAQMPLGRAMEQRYGACYATIHRADLQQILLHAVQQHSEVALHLQHRIHRLTQDAHSVALHTEAGACAQGDALLIADGVHSTLRAQLLGGAAARFSGHWAWRALLRQSTLPRHLRTGDVTLWLGPHLHAVQYPVRGGDMQNLVIVTETAHKPTQADLNAWSHEAPVQRLLHTLGSGCGYLQELAGHAPAAEGPWRLWPVYTCAPLLSSAHMAQHRAALLGDAAHPMPPYLAQGAGMAIEDAAALQQALARPDAGTPQRLRHYARGRWQRNARVQAQALRNGHIFHASAPLRWARDTALRLLGRRLLEPAWLYRG